jgi:hypothetical protein
MSIPEFIAAHPILAAAAALILRAILAWQHELTWPEYRALHAAKRHVFPMLNHVSPVFVHRTGGPQHAEYLGRTVVSPRHVTRMLRNAGFSLHLLASLKHRYGGQPAVAQLVVPHANGRQTECYLFHSRGGTAVYAHYERSAGSIRHVTSRETVAGDPQGVVPEAVYA